jgi:hypothetical protein
VHKDKKVTKPSQELTKGTTKEKQNKTKINEQRFTKKGEEKNCNVKQTRQTTHWCRHLVSWTRTRPIRVAKVKALL